MKIRHNEKSHNVRFYDGGKPRMAIPMVFRSHKDHNTKKNGDRRKTFIFQK